MCFNPNFVTDFIQREVNMERKKIENPIQIIIYIYLICVLFRGMEYMFIRTDQSILGEAFIHKLVGILIIIYATGHFSLPWYEIGFTKKNSLKYILYGLLLGFIVYVLAYGTELLLQLSRGNYPSLRLYVSSYAINGNQGMETGLLFFIICILGNIINVVMEEGMFRGLFMNLTELKYSFLGSVVISSTLFGIWHVAAPIRSLVDGQMNLPQTAVAALILMITTGLAGAKFCLLGKITGSIWMSMADHFFNNLIINTLHIITLYNEDALQMIRISIAQTLSFCIVLFLYWKSTAGQKPTFRT